MRQFGALVIISLLVIYVPAAMAAPMLKEPIKVGFLIPTVENPFWVRTADFAKEAGEGLGIEMIIENYHNREDEELADLESLIAKGVDGLMIVPQVTEIGPALLKKALEADIPVIGIDRWLGVEPGDPDYPNYLAFIGPDDEDAGYQIAKALHHAGADKLVSIHLFHGASVTEDRASGMRRAQDEFGMENLAEDWGMPAGETRQWGLVRIEDYLSRFPPDESGEPQFNGIWNVCDKVGMGAVKAIEDNGLHGKVLGAGMDLDADAMRAIRDGTYLFTTGGHMLQGGFGAIMLYDKWLDVDPTEKIVKIDMAGADASNVDIVEESLVPYPKDFDFLSISRYHNPEMETYFNINDFLPPGAALDY